VSYPNDDGRRDHTDVRHRLDVATHDWREISRRHDLLHRSSQLFMRLDDENVTHAEVCPKRIPDGVTGRFLSIH
jgi:hypothetical protein